MSLTASEPAPCYASIAMQPCGGNGIIRSSRVAICAIRTRYYCLPEVLVL